MSKTEINDIWAVELELLKKLVDVCEKYNLKYYPSGGTLLGCVRHGGFIPWDDDIDIDMPRADFEILISIADKEFKYPYFLQTAQTDIGYFSGHAKLRNSITTGIIAEDLYFEYNKGIFIDIFPLDTIPDNKIKAYLFCKEIYVMRSIIILGSPAYYAYPHRFIGRLLRPLCKFAYHVINVKRFALLYDRLCMKYNKNVEFHRIAAVSTFPERKKIRWDKQLFDVTQFTTFENISIKIPASYDKILKKQFGRYWIPIKEESNHLFVYIDARTPYSEFIKRIEK